MRTSETAQLYMQVINVIPKKDLCKTPGKSVKVSLFETSGVTSIERHTRTPVSQSDSAVPCDAIATQLMKKNCFS